MPERIKYAISHSRKDLGWEIFYVKMPIPLDKAQGM
jgi:hypothetical protein